MIGSTDADVVNAAATYLAKIVRERNLPEKLLIVHRFTDDMIARADRLRQVRGVQTVVNVDGFGATSVKVAKYHSFVRTTPRDAPRLQVVLQGGRADHVPQVGHGAHAAPRRGGLRVAGEPKNPGTQQNKLDAKSLSTFCVSYQR